MWYREATLEHVREVKVDHIVVFLRTIFNPNAGKGRRLERLRDVRETELGDSREKCV